MQIFCKFTKKIFVLFLTLFNILMVIVLSVGSTTDEHGHTRPVAFMPYRVNGQYIMEVAKKTALQKLNLISFQGLASSFMFSLGGAGLMVMFASILAAADFFHFLSKGAGSDAQSQYTQDKPHDAPGSKPKNAKIVALNILFPPFQLVGFGSMAVSFVCCFIFMRMKLPGYMQS